MAPAPDKSARFPQEIRAFWATGRPLWRNALEAGARWQREPREWRGWTSELGPDACDIAAQIWLSVSLSLSVSQLAILMDSQRWPRQASAQSTSKCSLQSNWELSLDLRAILKANLLCECSEHTACCFVTNKTRLRCSQPAVCFSQPTR